MQANEAVSTRRLWHTLLQRKVLTEVHHFQEVDYRACSRKRALEELPRKLPQELFRAGGPKPKLPLKQVVSSSDKVSPVEGPREGTRSASGRMITRAII